jgi:hypothetical protein
MATIHIVSTKIKGEHYTPGDSYKWQHIIHNSFDKANEVFENMKMHETLNVALNRVEIQLPE